MSRFDDSTLNWHKTRSRAGAPEGVVWRAWAPVLDPEASMPPYYQITQRRRRFPERHVQLVECKSCGGAFTPICTVTSLEDAKRFAQQDYNDRKKQL